MTNTALTITITVSENPSNWSDECDEETARKAASILADAMAAEAREAYPQADVTARTQMYGDGESTHLVRVTGVAADDVETWEAIHATMEAAHERLWPEAIEQANGGPAA